MNDVLGSISNFFARHRAHCGQHETYQPECAACVSANDGGFVASWATSGIAFVDGDASSEMTVSDTSVADASITDCTDFGGFGGGDSGGGGASGDF